MTREHPLRKYLLVIGAIISAVAVVVLLFVATDSGPRRQAVTFEPHTGSSFTVAVIGDSWSAGAGSDSNTSFSSFGKIATRELGVNGVIFAARGTGYAAISTAGGVYRERVDRVAAVQPDLVLVQGSVNDTRKATPNEVRVASKQLFEELRAALPGTVIVAMGPMDALMTNPVDTLASSRAIRESAKEEGVGFIDPIAGKWLPLDADLFSDGLHPNQAGYDLIADALAESLRPYLR